MTALELPQHIAESDEWKAWPRKAEAHLMFGARERQVTALCRSKKLRSWSCPDGTVRLDPGELKEHFGEPGLHQGRDRLPADPAKRKLTRSEDFDMTDPLSSLFREVVLMLRESRQEKSDVLKLVVDPMNAILATFQQIVAELRGRTKELEAGWIDVVELRDEQQAAAAARQVAVVRQQAEEHRLNELFGMLKEQAPMVLEKWAGGNSLIAFVRSIDPQILSAFLETDGILTAEQKEKLRRAAGASQRSNEPNNSNGKAAVA